MLISNHIPLMQTATAQVIGDTCLCLHAKRAARRVARRFDEAFAPLDLTSGQFTLMVMLAARSNWNMQALADALGVDRSSLTAALKPLERRRLVATGHDPKDKRVRQLTLSRAGHALLDEARPIWRRVQTETETMLKSGADAARALLNQLA